MEAAVARTAEADALMHSQHRAMAAPGANPFGAASMAMNPFLLQQEMLRRQELERALSGGLAFHGRESELAALSRRENELLRLRQNQMMEAELASRSRLAAAGLAGGGLPLTAFGGNIGGLGLNGSSGREVEAVNGASSLAAPASRVASELARLSADERDKLSQVADQTYRSALEANGLPSAGSLSKSEEELKKIGDKDLAHEAELRDSVQRRLMEEEALAEQQKNHAVALQRELLGGAFDTERAELIYRQQQQEEMLRLLQVQQMATLPGEDILSLQARMRGAMAMSMTNPYLMGSMGGK